MSEKREPGERVDEDNECVRAASAAKADSDGAAAEGNVTIAGK